MTTWKRMPDEGWLSDEPAYQLEASDGTWWVARDYGSDDDTKMEWFLHFYKPNGDGDFISSFSRLGDAKSYVAGTAPNGMNPRVPDG